MFKPSLLTSLASIALAAGIGAISRVRGDLLGDKGHGAHVRQHRDLTQKQARARAASKRARKARRITRMYS
jgi:hypothetical protein